MLFIVELRLVVDGVDEIVVLLLSSLTIVAFTAVVVVVVAVLVFLFVEISVDVVVSAVELRLVVDDNSLKVTCWLALVEFITLNSDDSTVAFKFDFVVVNNVVEFRIIVVVLSVVIISVVVF